MKKLFISCPMKGRTRENIEKSMDKMHKMAELIFDQELEVIQSYIEEEPPKNVNERIWYLGKSILLLSEADYYIGVDYTIFYSGCKVENRVAEEYGVPHTYVSMSQIMPDAQELEHEWLELENPNYSCAPMRG